MQRLINHFKFMPRQTIATDVIKEEPSPDDTFFKTSKLRLIVVIE